MDARRNGGGYQANEMQDMAYGKSRRIDKIERLQMMAEELRGMLGDCIRSGAAYGQDDEDDEMETLQMLASEMGEIVDDLIELKAAHGQEDDEMEDCPTRPARELPLDEATYEKWINMLHPLEDPMEIRRARKLRGK